MKKSILTLAVAVTLLFANSFGQVTDKKGANTGTSSTSTGSSTSAPSTKGTSDNGSSNKDKVKDEMSKDAATTAKEWTQKMDEVCDLTPDQEKKIMEINLRYANKLEELKQKYHGMDNPNAEAAKNEKNELTRQRLEEYSKVLSKEQMHKFKDYRDSLKDDNGDSASKKDEAKEKYQNASPEEKEKMKEEMKEKKEKKAGS